MAISIDDVRNYMFDTSWKENDLLLDVEFTDEQIQAAMNTVIREWNSIPPYVYKLEPGADLPNDTNMFLDGIVAALLRALLLNKMRNEVSVQAGNMAVATDTSYINQLKSIIPVYERRFQEAATAQKIYINLNQAYGQVG